jgi:hypothetical protein
MKSKFLTKNQPTDINTTRGLFFNKLCQSISHVVRSPSQSHVAVPLTNFEWSIEGVEFQDLYIMSDSCR